MYSVVPLRSPALQDGDDDVAETSTGVLLPMPPRVKPWRADVCCSLVDTAGLRELHAAARWVIELYPPERDRDYPEFEVTVYHTGWAEALTLQAFGPPRDAAQRTGREHTARLLHQVLSASYQARP